MYQALRLSHCPGRSRDMRPWAHNTVVSMPSTCGLTSWGSRNNLDVGQHWQPVSSSCCWCPANGPPEKITHKAQEWFSADLFKSFRQITRLKFYSVLRTSVNSLWVCVFQWSCRVWDYGSSEDGYCDLLCCETEFHCGRWVPVLFWKNILPPSSGLVWTNMGK